MKTVKGYQVILVINLNIAQLLLVDATILHMKLFLCIIHEIISLFSVICLFDNKIYASWIEVKCM